jgi:hypothetical protein
MPKEIVEHLLHEDVFLSDADILVRLFCDEECLKIFGFYTLQEEDIESGIRFRMNEIIQDKPYTHYYALVDNGKEETKYVYDETTFLFVSERKKKTQKRSQKSN